MYHIIEEFEKLNTQNRADLMLELMHCNARLINKKNNTENINNNFRLLQKKSLTIDFSLFNFKKLELRIQEKEM